MSHFHSSWVKRSKEIAVGLAIGTARLPITSLKFGMATRNYGFQTCRMHEWLCNREMAVVQNVSGDRNSLSSPEPFFPHSIPKQTQGKQKAQSTYFEYASQVKRTNHSGLNLRCFPPVSEETGNSYVLDKPKFIGIRKPCNRRIN